MCPDRNRDVQVGIVPQASFYLDLKYHNILIGSNSLCVVVFQLISICYFTPDINLAAILFESLSIFHNGAVILLQSTQQSTVIPVIQIGVIGIVRGIEKAFAAFSASS